MASAPLLEFAIARAKGELKDYYTKHLVEERGHDEMLLEDLKGLGVGSVPFNFSAALVAGSQYYLIAHEHPALLLGYMIALEREPMPMEMVKSLEVQHGASLSALAHHAEHDRAHLKDLVEQFMLLPASLQERVLWNEARVRAFLIAEARASFIPLGVQNA